MEEKVTLHSSYQNWACALESPISVTRYLLCFSLLLEMTV